MLGALSSNAGGKITPLGQRIMSLPTHPRLARLLIDAADAGIARDGAAIAALLAEKDIVLTDNSVPPWARGPATVGPSDLLLRMDLLAELERRTSATRAIVASIGWRPDRWRGREMSCCAWRAARATEGSPIVRRQKKRC
jgi:HrpA-like RNA helicase